MTKTSGLVGLLIVILLAIGANMFLALTAYDRTNGRVERNTRGNRANCLELQIVKTGLRETLQEGERVALDGVSAHARPRVVTFYRDALARLKPRRC